MKKRIGGVQGLPRRCNMLHRWESGWTKRKRCGYRGLGVERRCTGGENISQVLHWRLGERPEVVADAPLRAILGGWWGVASMLQSDAFGCMDVALCCIRVAAAEIQTAAAMAR